MNGQQTLLQKAKNIQTERRGRPRQEIDSEMVELAIAWCKGEVKEFQVCKATGITKGTFQHLMLRSLRQYILNKETNPQQS